MPDGVGTTHDVKIGDHHYLVRPGSYRKRGAQQFGARFTTGDPDYNNLSAWQHWVQRCWVGGAGATEWKDDAMFDESSGVDTRHHELMVLSRDLGPKPPGFDRVAANWNVEPGGVANGAYAKKFFVRGGYLYCLNMGNSASQAWIYRFNSTTAAWDHVGTFVNGAWPHAICVVGGSVSQPNVWFGISGNTMHYMYGAPGAEQFNQTILKPSGRTEIPYAMKVYKNRIYVGFGSHIWRLKMDGTWDGSTAFYTDEGIDQIIAMEVHQGFLYMASSNGHILRTDGNNTFDMFQFEQTGGIVDIKSFDGRLFIMYMDSVEGVNVDPRDGGQSRHVVLYQLSGSALTELKRWGRVGRWLTAGNMHVVDGKLYFGAPDQLGQPGGGFGIAMYDPVEDAYHMVATCQDGVAFPEGTNQINYGTSDVVYWGGYLWLATYGHGIWNTTFTYRDMQQLTAAYDTTQTGAYVGTVHNGGWYSSSDFDAGTPGLQKIWNAIILNIDLPDPACSAHVEYSLDGGTTWEDAGTITTLAAARLDHEIILGDGVTEVRGSRFKYRITLMTTDSAYSPILRGVAVRYLPVPEPNWQWDMTLVLSDTQELHDGTVQTPDNVLKIAALRDAFRTQSLVHFQDHDLAEYASGGSPGVIIQSMEEMVPVLGPLSDGDREYEVRVTLLEMVEAYEA